MCDKDDRQEYGTGDKEGIGGVLVPFRHNWDGKKGKELALPFVMCVFPFRFQQDGRDGKESGLSLHGSCSLPSTKPCAI